MANQQEDKELLGDFDIEGFTASLEGDPKSIEILLGEQKITIQRATATHMMDVIDIVRQLMLSLGMKSVSELSNLEGVMNSPVSVLGMIQDMFPRIRALSIKLSSIDAKGWDALDFDEMLILIWAQWQVNEHFFMGRLPALLNMIEAANLKPAAAQPQPAATPAGDAASES